MTRRIATLQSISMQPDTRSSKATIRQKDGDGAISTKSSWAYPTVPRLSSVQFHGITDAMPSTGKVVITRKTPLTAARLSFHAGYRLEQTLPR